MTIIRKLNRFLPTIKLMNLFNLRKRQNQWLLLVLFSLVVLYFNFRAVDRLHSVPPYQSKCDFKFAKSLLENLVTLFFVENSMISIFLIDSIYSARLIRPRKRFWARRATTCAAIDPHSTSTRTSSLPIASIWVPIAAWTIYCTTSTKLSLNIRT